MDQPDKPQLPQFFVKMLRNVTAKRARTVIDHILEHGYITTEELGEKYGYDHPPRAARDVRESGIPLETFRVRDSRGRRIGAYRFGDPEEALHWRVGGRRTLPKQLKRELMEREDSRCQVCLTSLDGRYLQIDHRVPYEIGGESAGKLQASDFMLLFGSCNRAKSWSCEHCENWTGIRAPELCKTCYWGDPTDYSHIALLVIRRLDLTWTEGEVSDYDRIVRSSEDAKEELPDFVKSVLQRWTPFVAQLGSKNKV